MNKVEKLIEAFKKQYGEDSEKFKRIEKEIREKAKKTS